ncbi:hypothetical protein GE061_009408 [Apolygus lucorum]|uniref:Uncharacterized protein n=1 Tax=Apolygus lucorum TaxID=248454 RepID=A0A8S9Y477_APOLU|nr:hypothetical protein GE061_009408 [Apolygus lucorum]
MASTQISRIPRLQDHCMDALYPLLEKYSANSNSRAAGPLDNLAGDLTEMLMERAYLTAPAWTTMWYLFLTPKIKRAYLPWDTKVWRIAKNKCRNLREVFVFTRNVKFKTMILDLLPGMLTTLDLHGDLFYRGRPLPRGTHNNWLTEAEAWLRSMKVEKDIKPEMSGVGLSEIHLGDAQVSSEDLIVVLTHLPHIKLLRHYQMTRALCSMHGQTWRSSPSSAPTYELTNIDADFSHVVRCRMEPTAVLPGDALRLAVTLCPKATSVRLRVDSSTPHHVVAPLTALKNLHELTAVCVTSGERPLLDFSDLAPILEKFGPQSLRTLELKVLEEVDPHVIGKSCNKLERLTLSGCGFKTPSTCAQFRCKNQPLRLPALKLLFYADGDDFSWDHSLPPCFWRSTMSSNVRMKSLLEGVFLESPRIPVEVLQDVFSPKAAFPFLSIFSVCRSSELTPDHLQDVSKSMSSLKYLRLSKCDNIGVRNGVKIKRMFPGVELKIN